MNTIWLKIAGGAVLVLALIIGVASFMGGDSSSAPEVEESAPKTYQDTVEEDRKNHPVIPPEPIAEEEVAAEKVQEEEPPTETVSITRQQADPEPETPKVIYVKPLDEAEELQAQQLLSWAGTTYSIGRLPVMQYGTPVRNCKDVISRWPESWYAYQAKRLLADIIDIRPRYRQQYDLTDELLDVSTFYEKRRGTQALPIEN